MQKDRIWWIIGTLLLVLNFSGAAFSMTTYDNFSSSTINCAKWDSQEFVREIRQINGVNKLVSKVTGYGIINANYLYVKNPGGIYYLEAYAALTFAVAPYDSTQTTYSHAGVMGVFYNDGTVGTGSVGDVMAQVRLELSRGQLKARWYVIRYTSSDRSTWDTLDSGTIGGTISLNTTYKLAVQFDSPNKKFTFTVGANTAEWTTSGTTDPPGSDWKALRTYVDAPEGYLGSVSATYVNVLATDKDSSGSIVMSDTFSTLAINSDNWGPNLEIVREIENNHLRLRHKRINLTASSGNALPLKLSEMVNEIQAGVSLLEFEKTVSDTGLQARISGYFLNLTGSTNNYQDEVYAAIYLGGSDATAKAKWYVLKMTDSTGSTNETLASGTLVDSITFGVTYTLYLHWDGNQFTFRCSDSGGDHSATYTPSAVHPSNIKYKELNARILAPTNSTNNSTISATFDDIMTDIRNLFLPLILKN